MTGNSLSMSNVRLVKIAMMLSNGRRQLVSLRTLNLGSTMFNFETLASQFWFLGPKFRQRTIHFTIISPCVCLCECGKPWIKGCKQGATAHLPMLPNEAMEDVVEGFMDAWTCTCALYGIRLTQEPARRLPFVISCHAFSRVVSESCCIHDGHMWRSI